MKQFDIQEINKWNPCYPPERHLSPSEKYTVLSILDRKDIPFEDRLWVILRPEMVSDKLMRLFAVWCARQVQHLMKDERSTKALDVAEAFANGMATIEELAAAWDAARAAAWDAAWAAAWAAARAAAWAAAWDAAQAAAQAAAWAAAWDAAQAAALAAAWAAAWDAALAAARAAAWDAQESKLMEMIIEGIKTGDVK